jgi:hypothetical protein
VELLDLPGEDAEVGPAPLDQLLHGGRRDLTSGVAREAHHPRLHRARVVQRRKSEGGPAAQARAEELAPLVRGARHEDERPAGAERREDREEVRLRVGRQRVGVADDEHLRPPEQRRRPEVVERRGEPARILVAPQRAPRAGPPRRQEAIPERAERALDQERLLAEQEVVRTEGLALQRGEGVARAQKPSIAWR